MHFQASNLQRFSFAGAGLALLTFLTIAVAQEPNSQSATKSAGKKSATAGDTQPTSGGGASDPFQSGPAKKKTGRTTGGGKAGDPFDSGGGSAFPGGGGGDSGGSSAFPGGGGLSGGGGFSGGGGGFGGGAFGGGGFGAASRINPRLVQGTGLMISWSKENDQLRGFSVSTGNWTPLNISRQKIIVPVVGDSVAAVRVGDSMAAYSSKTGTWDVLKLAKKSSAVPVVHTRLITVNDNGYLYTFAADSAKWTSPDDPRLRRGGTLKGSLRSQWPSQPPGASDPNTVSIIGQYRGGEITKATAIAAVRRAVFEEFDRRQKTQARQAARLREKLAQLETAIKQRQENRTAIVERRVQQLLKTPGATSQTKPTGASGGSVSR